VDADGQEPAVETGGAAGDNQVACQDHVHAGTHRRTVHGCDRGQRGVGHTEEPPVDVGERTFGIPLSGFQQVIQDGSGAKGPTGAGEHHRSDAVVGLQAVEGR